MLTLPPSDHLRLVAFGGLGEIGLNLMAFDWNGQILLIDAGLMFPEAYLPGIDIVLPDITALEERTDDIVAWVITHGHEDHIGALPYLWQRLNRPPVYATEFTLALIKAKLDEHNLSTGGKLHRLTPGEPVTVGAFSVEGFAVAHSTVDGVGLAIRTPAGLIVHTGDFNLDPTPLDGRCTDVDRLTELGKEGVLLLLADSTNVEKTAPSPSEKSVGYQLHSIIAKSKRRVLVSTFSSNIHRIQQVINAAAASGRNVCVHGRSMEQTVAIARRLGYLTASESGLQTLKQAMTLPPEQCVILTTGSQGEPLSALMRIALGEHKEIALQADDHVILSSKFIPGNERAIGYLIDLLCRQGATVDHEQVADIHVSGHASQAELAEVHRRLQPRYFVPIHGQYRHLVHHARLAGEWTPTSPMIITNGQALDFGPAGASKSLEVATGRLLVDGTGVGDLSLDEMRERRKLSTQGLVMVQLARSGSGEITDQPRLITRGLIGPTEHARLAEAEREVMDHLQALQPAEIQEDETLEAQTRIAVRRFFKRHWARRPEVVSMITETQKDS